MNKDEIGKEIIASLYQEGIIKIFPRDNEEGWFLHCDKWSPFYIQMRTLFSKNNSSELIDKINDAMIYIIKNELPKINKLVGIATAAIPLSAIISYKSKIPLCYTKRINDARSLPKLEERLKEIDTAKNSEKNYGEYTLIDGDLEDGDNIILIDDIITNGESKLIAMKRLRYYNLVILILKKHQNVV